jgi:hypothetical protein
VPWVEPASWTGLLTTGSAGLTAYLMGVVLLEFGPSAMWHRLQGALEVVRGRAFANRVPVSAVPSAEGPR